MAMEPVLEALIKYRLTASLEEKAADLARLEKECHTTVDAYEYINAISRYNLVSREKQSKAISFNFENAKLGSLFSQYILKNGNTYGICI